jgi:hypothetical protein
VACTSLAWRCRDCLCPVVLTRGSDQTAVSTKFDMRGDPNVIRNYGRMLVDLCCVVPDGVVCFFVSYLYMDTIVSKWNEMGVLQARNRGSVYRSVRCRRGTEGAVSTCRISSPFAWNFPCTDPCPDTLRCAMLCGAVLEHKLAAAL